ncbi:FAD-dependent oxidoreductase [Paenibacillus sp. sptzw28]|uniref:NAD(P)/FAD-dependent oxidoreductase n=1 Tax=Paenibacillus sp. sptzw28 TaxID=715179 RepID=UPI001C6E5562|nr:FAD-dependent oxidoreductase [Paenibacillus sp. sptzw28]QYR19499.1 FAD-dependent oxidoreductase [Paenibacillus sp. sptzw28]
MNHKPQLQPQSQKDLIVVGAGPAGLSAAAVAASHGLRVAVVDEFPEPGGRLPGQFHEERGKGWWIGRHLAAELIEENRRSGVEIRCGVSVYGILQKEDKWEVSTSLGKMTAPYVLLATGAAEAPIPADGWTLPGVMSIGAAQVMTNVHYVKPGERGIIIGVNVLAMAIARELAVSGVNLAGIVLPAAGPFSGKSALPETNLQLLMNLSHLAPSAFMRYGGQLANAMKLSRLIVKWFPGKGVNVWGIPVRLRTAVVSINGVGRVESVTLTQVNDDGSPVPGSEREEPVDFVALAGGLYPLAELASVAGCPFIHVPELGGYIPVHSEQMRTPVKGLYVAGNITGVESALVAAAQGRLAAASICSDSGASGEEGERFVLTAEAEVHRVRSSALIQFHPGIAEARRSVYRLWRETMTAER